MLVSVVHTQDQAMITTNRMTKPLLHGVDDIGMPQSGNGITPPALPRREMNFTILLSHALINIYSTVQ